MNEKKTPKKDQAPAKPKRQTTRKKKEGWFARNKTIFTLSIETLVVIIIILLAFWYFSFKVSLLDEQLKQSQQKIDSLEKKMTEMITAQRHTTNALRDLKSQLAQADESTAAPIGKKDKSATKSKKSVARDSSDIKDKPSGIGWETWLVIILILGAVIMAYFALRKSKKNNFDDAF